MLLNFGILLNALLLVGGLWWCKEVLENLRNDVGRMKTSKDTTEKGVIVFIWILTMAIGGLVINFVYGIVKDILDAM